MSKACQPKKKKNKIKQTNKQTNNLVYVWTSHYIEVLVGRRILRSVKSVDWSRWHVMGLSTRASWLEMVCLSSQEVSHITWQPSVYTRKWACLTPLSIFFLINYIYGLELFYNCIHFLYFLWFSHTKVTGLSQFFGAQVWWDLIQVM